MKNKNIFDLPKPTEEEINHTGKMIEDKYDTIIPKKDLARIVILTKELNRWIEISKSSSSKRVSDEMIVEFKELVRKRHGKEISSSEAYDEAHSLLTFVPYKEKQKIADEIRAIIVTHRPIPCNPIVEEKVAKLFQLHYGVNLTSSQLGQVVQYLTRHLWCEEGLNESLEKCLDDLLIYIDKRKRGKRVNRLNLHNEIRKAFDEAMSKMKLIDEKFVPLYQEE